MFFQSIRKSISPLIVIQKYPSAQAPPNHYKFPLCEEFESQYPHSVLTPHGPYPLYREPQQVEHSISHYGIHHSISRPLITIPAKLIYFSRRQVVPFSVPPQLPLTRAHAIQLGVLEVGPTQADIIEVNAHLDTKLVPQTVWDWWEDLTDEELLQEDNGIASMTLASPSSKWDNDWMRLAYCSNPWIHVPGKGRVYTTGLLTGLWQGRMLVSLDRLLPFFHLFISFFFFTPVSQRTSVHGTRLHTQFSSHVFRTQSRCFGCSGLYAAPGTPLRKPTRARQHRRNWGWV